jgi:predicted enzyme related to lactoylglutathione lyase
MLPGVVAIGARSFVLRVAVVYFYVRDMSRSVAFYRDLLGIPLAGDDDWVEAPLPGGMRFALHRTHEGVGPLSSGTVHVDFEVADVDTVADRLRAAGVEVRETMRDEWGTAVEVVDPDGYRVYLYQAPG